jgi:signal transduction histidine kinase
MVQPLAEQGTQLELDLPAALPPLRADPDRLTQVLLNLLANAAKVVPRPGGRIRVRLRRDDGRLVLRVHDNGPDVPAADRESIFEKFHQVGDAALRPGGTGLGLPISRRIVEHYGGQLRVVADPGHGDADLGQGACLEFTLPLMRAAPAADENNPSGDKPWPVAS